MAFAKNNITDGRRVIVDGSKYEKLFPKPNDRTFVANPNADAPETVAIMKEVVKNTLNETKQITDHLFNNNLRQFLNNIWSFLYNHIQYKLDDGEEIRTPARSWQERENGIDCDCFSVFVSSILTNANIPHAFRIAKYFNAFGFPRSDYQHVYVIIPKDLENYYINNKSNYYTIDCVLSQFDYEKKFSNKKDFIMEGIKVKVLSGFDGDNSNDLMLSIDGLSGLGSANEKEDLQKIYDHLIATRDAILKNPQSIALFDDPDAQIKMLDYAIQYFWTRERDNALKILAANENNLNALEGFDEEDDDSTMYGLEGTFAGFDGLGLPMFRAKAGQMRKMVRNKQVKPIRYNRSAKRFVPVNRNVRFKFRRIQPKAKNTSNYVELKAIQSQLVAERTKLMNLPADEKSRATSLIDALNIAINMFFTDKRPELLQVVEVERQNFYTSHENNIEDENYIEEIPDYIPEDEEIAIEAEEFEDEILEGFGFLGGKKRKKKKKSKKGFFNAIGKAVKGIGKGVKGLVKGVIRFNPATIAARNGILAAMKMNFNHLGERLAWAYGTEAHAKSKGKSANDYQGRVRALKKTEKLFESIGGKKKNLKKAILSSKKAKATGVSGFGFLGNMFGDPDFDQMDMELDGLGIPVAVPVVGAALPFLAKIAGFLKQEGVNDEFGEEEENSYEITDEEGSKDSETNLPVETNTVKDNSKITTDKRSIGKWIKENPLVAGAIGIVTLGAAGFGIHTYLKKRKKKEKANDGDLSGFQQKRKARGKSKKPYLSGVKKTNKGKNPVKSSSKSMQVINLK